MANNTNNRRRNNNRRRSNNCKCNNCSGNNSNSNNSNSNNSNSNNSNNSNSNNSNSNNSNSNSNSNNSNNNNNNIKNSNNNKNNKNNNNNNNNNNNDYNDTTNQNNKRGRGALAPDYDDNSRKNHRTSQSGPRENDYSPSSTATTVAANGSVCQHPMCIELARQGVQRTHADAWCFRFKNPKRFESILRQQRRRGLLSDPQSYPSSSLTVPDNGQQRQQQQPKSLVSSGKRAAAAQSHAGELDEDLKTADYLYMKDKKLQPAITSTSTRDAGFPHSTTWRYMFDEGGEEPAPAPAPAIANGNGKNNGGLVSSALSGSTQTLSNLTSTMSRGARQRARRAARKAEARNNTINCNTIGGSGDGNGSSLNTSKQQPQKSHTQNTATAAPAVTRTRVMDGRGMWTWDDECDEWDRPYSIQEAQDVLAFIDKLNWESHHRVRNSEYSFTPSPPPTLKVAARLAESSVVRKGSLRVDNVTASASAAPIALKKPNVIDPLKRAVSVRAGAPPAPRTFTGGFRGVPPGDNRIAAPVTINGVVLTALLVSGRAKSCIDRQVAVALGLRVWSDPALKIIDRYRTVKTQHTCNAVEARCNGYSVKAILDVDDLNYYDLHIGADLFHAFGFSITICK